MFAFEITFSKPSQKRVTLHDDYICSFLTEIVCKFNDITYTVAENIDPTSIFFSNSQNHTPSYTESSV